MAHKKFRLTVRNTIRYMACLVSFIPLHGYAQTSDENKEYQRLQMIYESTIPTWIHQFEKSIQAFEKEDSIQGRPIYDVVFIGSSTFAHWKTMQQDFAPAKVINRGFGGASIREVIHYSNRILFPYQPKIVVLYVGSDVWGRADEPSTATLFEYFTYFEKMLHREMPNTMLNFISMRPSPLKKNLIKKQNDINALLKSYAAITPQTNYIGICTQMYAADGELRTDIFVNDNLHLNDTGNQLITDVVKPVILKQLEKESMY